MALHKLNLRGTRIKEVREGLGMLKNLKCLFLCGSMYDNILEIDEIADGALSNLSKLEELIVNRSKIKLKGDVVGRLKKLEVFHGRFPTVNDMTIFLKCQPDRLSWYFITIGSNFNSDQLSGDINGFMHHSSYAKMRVVSYVEEMLPRYKKILLFNETNIVGENALLPSVQVLCIKACQGIRSLNDFSAIKDETVTDLRRCWITNCDGLRCLLSSWINNPIVQTLVRLDLYFLHNLDGLFEAEVAKSPPPPRAFSSLKEVAIGNCNKIKKLFPSWKLVEYLQSLELISIRECKEMEEIIASDLEGGEEERGDMIKKLSLPKLKYLRLEHLPTLKSISSRRTVMVCDSLEKIAIRDCKGLRRIPLYLDNAQPSLPHSLKTIKIGQEEQQWWESLECDHPNAKLVLGPLLRLYPYSYLIRSLESEQSESEEEQSESSKQLQSEEEQSELAEKSESEQEQSESEEKQSESEEERSELEEESSESEEEQSRSEDSLGD